MPLAQVVSNGEDMSIWYDVYGRDATAAEPDLNALESNAETSGGRSGEGMIGTLLGAVNCNCIPEAGPTSRRTVSSEDVYQDSHAHGAGRHTKDAGSAQRAPADLIESMSADASAQLQNKRSQGKTGVTSPSRPSPAPHKSRNDEQTTSTSGRFSSPECHRVLFIAGLGARGRTEFFQHIVEHLASLLDSSGNPILSVCTFDSRGIGGSTIPEKRRTYTTKAMAYDTLALLDHLGWAKVHIIGLSLGGFVGCKLAAMQPHRVATLMLIGTTPSGWHMLAGISTQPLMATLAGSGPLKWRIPANLRYNFSDHYLEEKVDGDRTRMQVLIDNTFVAIEEKNTEKFLAEGQPTVGREGHLAAVFKHRMSEEEIATIRSAQIPCVVLVGRYDRLARAHYVSKLAKRLHCTYVVVEAGHAGIMIEALDTVVPLLESSILGNAQTSASHVRRLGLLTNEVVLQNQLYAREFASSFAPGRVSFKRVKSAEQISPRSSALPRSKSAV